MTPDAFDQARREASRGNREVLPAWDRYDGHRRRLTSLLLRLGSDGGRLCLLGAGNCYDVDLEALAAHFQEIHLVDLDREAVARGIARYGDDVRQRLFAHAPVDLSGLLEPTDDEPEVTDPFAALAAQIPRAVDGVIGRLPGPFDLVASCCVLSQMSWQMGALLGPSHPLLPPVRDALITIHGRTLARLTRPGGAALLATDSTSSARCLALRALPGPEAPAPEALRRLLATPSRPSNAPTPGTRCGCIACCGGIPSSPPRPPSTSPPRARAAEGSTRGSGRGPSTATS